MDGYKPRKDDITSSGVIPVKAATKDAASRRPEFERASIQTVKRKERN